MPGIDKFLTRRTTLGYQTSTQRVELPTGVNIHSINFRLYGEVTIASGTTSGTVITEGVQRLVPRIRVDYDGTDLVPNVSARQLVQIHARNVAQIIAPVQLASGDAQSDTPIYCDFSIPFSRQYDINPIDTCLPGILPVGQGLALFVDFDTSLAGTGTTDPGSGALISGGDRDITLANIALVIEIVYSTTLFHPAFIGTIRTLTTEQISAANTELPLRLSGVDPYDAVLFRYLNGSAQDVQEAFNFLTFEGSSGSVQYFRDVDATMLQRADLGLFPAAERAGQTGTIFIRHADQGRLSSRVIPRSMPDPRYTFNVDAPSSSPGFVQATLMTLMRRPGVTRDDL